MARLTIYLPDKIEKQARTAAKATGKSVSRWIADQLGRTLADTWPQSVLDAAGAFRDFPGLREIRRGYGRDLPRESIE
ncbi:MAG: CopG family transcriptional regulator [Bryobacteraceae bacterium]